MLISPRRFAAMRFAAARVAAARVAAARCVALVLGAAIAIAPATGFRDEFDAPITPDPSGVHGWAMLTGDGTASMRLTAANGHATIHVDATTDRRNIWWAIMKRDVSSSIDLATLARPRTELRLQARVRTSHAPRRFNLSVNTQRTTDFHTNLMEFDVAEAGVWQTVSFTTRGFDARPGDRVNAQLALMDWGLDRYQLDVDHFSVDVVDPATAGPDLGEHVPYRPAVRDPRRFRHAVAAVQSATIDRREPDAVLHDWSAFDPTGPTSVLTVNGSQRAILRWDLGALGRRTAAGGGLLELRTHSVRRPAARRKDFGLLRVVEIVGGDPTWERRSVSHASLSRGRADEEVFNGQMIVDVEVTDAPGGSTLITIPRPVLQRLLDGRTKGIALLPLGSLDAAFLAHPTGSGAPTLRFDLRD